MTSNEPNKSKIADKDDYGGIGPEEFERRILVDQEERYGAILREAEWESVEDPGW